VGIYEGENRSREPDWCGIKKGWWEDGESGEEEDREQEKRRRKLIYLPKWKKLWRHQSWGINGK
jgi:hypothetical protein